MAFVQQVPREFNKVNIEAIRPGSYGVYGLFRTNQWVYVGKGDIRTRLLAHFNGDNPSIIAMRPTHYVDEVLSVDPSLREKQLILELNPPCNQKIG
jgi:hypothetical protein